MFWTVQHKLNFTQVRIEYTCSQPYVFMHGSPGEIQTHHPGTWSAAPRPLCLLCYHPAVFFHLPGLTVLSFCQGILRTWWKMLLLMPFLLLKLFHKIAKSGIYVTSVCLHWTARLPPDGFSWNLIFDYFSKSAEKIRGTLKFDENNNYHSWRRRCIYEYCAEFFLEWEMFQTKVVGKITTFFLCSVTCLSKLCHLWDDVEKYCRAGRPTDKNITQRMLFACGKLRLQTHTQNM